MCAEHRGCWRRVVLDGRTAAVQPLCSRLTSLHLPCPPAEQGGAVASVSVTAGYRYLRVLLARGRISAPDCLSLAEPGRESQGIYKNTHILPYLGREEFRLFCFPLGNRFCLFFFLRVFLRKKLQKIVCIYRPKLTTDNMLLCMFHVFIRELILQAS